MDPIDMDDDEFQLLTEQLIALEKLNEALEKTVEEAIKNQTP